MFPLERFRGDHDRHRKLYVTPLTASHHKLQPQKYEISCGRNLCD